MAAGPRKKNETFKLYRKRLKDESLKDLDFLKGKKKVFINPLTNIPVIVRQHPVFWNSSQRGTYRSM